jgi:hypothetical protein
MKHIVSAVLLIVVFNITLSAKECNSDEILKLVNAGYDKQKIDSMCDKPADVAQTNTQAKSKDIDSWFAKFGIGAVSISYPIEIQQDVDYLDSLSYIDRTKLAIDMGVYFTVNDHYIAGFNINGHTDNFKNTTTNVEMSIRAYNYALSNIYFINQVEDGLFLRGDIGVTKFVVSVTGKQDVASDTGLGLALGGGYCFNLNVVSLQAEVLLTNYSAEGDTIQSAQLLFSVLF